jgi:integrase
MAAYEAALAGAPCIEIGASRTRPGTIDAAIVGYYTRSMAFALMSTGTKRLRRNVLERFRAEHGDKRVALLTRPHVERMVADKALATPAAARTLLKCLRALMQFCVSEGMRADDPTAGVKNIKLRSPGIYTWTEADIATYETKHPIGTRARLAFALLLYTAQRRGDVIRMGRQHIRDGVLQVTQQKTGAELKIPVHPDLEAIFAATPTEHLAFLTTAAGKPFTAAGFGNIFRDWCREAGLPEECSAHGLRKAACRRLAEAGASANIIAAISGHKTLREVERYTKAADQARMARAGIEMMTAAQPIKRTSSG